MGVICFFVFEINPVVWVLGEIGRDPTHGWVLLYWGAVLPVGIGLAGAQSLQGWMPQIIQRKCFHALAVILFVPPLVMCPEFLALSTAIALALMLLAEMLRLGRVPPFGPGIDSYVRPLIDRRDHGTILLTHIYLLLGCALPVWLVCFGVESVRAPLTGSKFILAAAGMISTGIGDAMGAIVGSTLAKRRYPGSKKSPLGSMAMLISMSGAITLILYLSQEAFPFLGTLTWLPPLVICTIVEATSCTIDNIVMPVLLLTVGLML